MNVILVNEKLPKNFTSLKQNIILCISQLAIIE